MEGGRRGKKKKEEEEARGCEKKYFLIGRKAATVNVVQTILEGGFVNHAGSNVERGREKH